MVLPTQSVIGAGRSYAAIIELESAAGGCICGPDGEPRAAHIIGRALHVVSEAGNAQEGHARYAAGNGEAGNLTGRAGRAGRIESDNRAIRPAITVRHEVSKLIGDGVGIVIHDVARKAIGVERDAVGAGADGGQTQGVTVHIAGVGQQIADENFPRRQIVASVSICIRHRRMIGDDLVQAVGAGEIIYIAGINRGDDIGSARQIGDGQTNGGSARKIIGTKLHVVGVEENVAGRVCWQRVRKRHAIAVAIRISTRSQCATSVGFGDNDQAARSGHRVIRRRRAAQDERAQGRDGLRTDGRSSQTAEAGSYGYAVTANDICDRKN